MRFGSLLAALAASVPLALVAQAPDDTTKGPAPTAQPAKKAPAPKKDVAPKKAASPKKDAPPKKDATRSPQSSSGTMQLMKPSELPAIRDKDGKVIPNDPNAYDVSSATGKK
jgi:hypothetical protein